MNLQDGAAALQMWTWKKVKCSSSKICQTSWGGASHVGPMSSPVISSSNKWLSSLFSSCYGNKIESLWS